MSAVSKRKRGPGVATEEEGQDGETGAQQPARKRRRGAAAAATRRRKTGVGAVPLRAVLQRATEPGYASDRAPRVAVVGRNLNPERDVKDNIQMFYENFGFADHGFAHS